MSVRTLSASTHHATRPMTSLNSKLKLAILNRKKARNLLDKGFTRVELMIVIVIVGVLSAVALPNFLSQTGKAKGTEAKAQISAIMKNGAAIYQQGGANELLTIMGVATGVADTCEDLGGPEDLGEDGVNTKTLFDYDCTVNSANETLTVVATANANDTSIEGNTIFMVIDLSAGSIETTAAETSRLFGGTKADV